MAIALSRLVRPGLSGWLALGVAVPTLAASALLIAVLPFRRLGRIMTFAPPAPLSNQPVATIRRLRWAVEAAARRVPWRTVCFQKGLALHWMLRARGIPSVLHYGVGKDPGGKFGAHVWVSVGGVDVLGGPEAAGYAEVARFPDPARG